MAVLDPRLIPLIETLAAADLDRLAFEIIEGLRRGVESEEPAETLEMARADAREKRPPPERVAARDPHHVTWAVDDRYVTEAVNS